MKITPAATYELVCKQLQSANTIIHCLEQRLAAAEKPRHEEYRAAKQLDSEREANARLTAELEAAQARIQELDAIAKVARRVVRDRRPGAGSATRPPFPYEGLEQRYAQFGTDYVMDLIHELRRMAVNDRSVHELHLLVGEPLAQLRSANDRLGQMLVEVDDAVASMMTDSRGVRGLAKDHPIRLAVERSARRKGKR